MFLRSTISAILYLYSFCVHSAIDTTLAGTQGLFPHTTEVRWINSSSQCTKSNPNTGTCILYQQTGTMEVTFTFSYASPRTDVAENMNASGSKVNTSICLNGHASGAYRKCTPREILPGLTCTPSDKGLFQQCLSRYQGQRFTMTVPVSIKREVGFPVCVDTSIFVISASEVGHANSYSEYITNSYNCIEGGGNVLPSPPEEKASVCTLDSQRLEITFTSNNLNVSGSSGYRDMLVSCSPGTPGDYVLKLTASNPVNGRLDFGNGVSAQISLNGSQVAANGSGIKLTGLTSQSLPVIASLVGTASGPGVTNTNGILVLEAL